jgi:hypothetical protein
MPNRLTRKQEEFARLVAEDGQSFVGAYRIVYPPRNGTRSRVAEQVAARRVAHRPLVEQRVEQLREQALATDPVEMRRRANTALARILSGRLDPRYRRTAMDVLRYLDQQEREAENVGWEVYRAAAAQIVDALGAGKRSGGRSPSIRPIPKQNFSEESSAGVPSERANELAVPLSSETAKDEDRRRSEIFQVVADRQRMRFGQPPVLEQIPQTALQQEELIQPVEEGTAEQFQRRPGHFGKGGWMRFPNAHTK